MCFGTGAKNILRNIPNLCNESRFTAIVASGPRYRSSVKLHRGSNDAPTYWAPRKSWLGSCSQDTISASHLSSQYSRPTWPPFERLTAQSRKIVAGNSAPFPRDLLHRAWSSAWPRQRRSTSLPVMLDLRTAPLLSIRQGPVLS
jgi:hypothetical protein